MKNIIFITGILCLFFGKIQAQSWKLNGNNGTVPGTDFIGTTDPAALVFKINNIKAGSLEYNSLIANTSFGYQALLSVAGGKFNSAFGSMALLNNTTGSYNTATGLGALQYNTMGNYNMANGLFALGLNTAGSDNTASGSNALESNTTGNYNTAQGRFSLRLNKTGYSNAAIGISALYNSSEGHNMVAVGDSALFSQVLGHNTYDPETGELLSIDYENTAIGSKSMYSNTSGYNNTATGFRSLYTNTTGSNNTAAGYMALFNSTANDNTAFGSSALVQNKEGANNTGVGRIALASNISGNENTATGANSLTTNSTGSYNTAIGFSALSLNTTQIRNTAVGWSAGAYHTSSSSTYVGAKASSSVNGISNSMALGFLASVSASYQVRVGSASITSIGGQVGWTTLSDGRFKKDIKENVPGLEFINKLKPVTYHVDATAVSKFLKEDKEDEAADKKGITEKEKIIYTGLVAQDVEKAAKEINYDFSGVDAAKNKDDYYGLRYAEFVVPLIKSVQQLSKQNDDLSSENKELRIRLEKIEQVLIANNISAKKNILTGIMLEQNTPNPFRGSTAIHYQIPVNFSKAVLLITNTNGVTVKSYNLESKPRGSIVFDAGTLTAGTYYYTLFMDGKKTDSKKMMIE